MARADYARKLLKINKNEDAKKRLEALAEFNKDKGEIFHLMGIAEFRLGNNETAIEQINKAIEVEPENELFKSELEALNKAIAGEE